MQKKNHILTQFCTLLFCSEESITETFEDEDEEQRNIHLTLGRTQLF